VLLTTSRRQLQSSTSHRLEASPVRLSKVGKKAFPVSGATVGNDLPLHVASALSLAVLDNNSRPFCFSVPTKTLSYESWVDWKFRPWNCRTWNAGHEFAIHDKYRM